MRIKKQNDSRKRLKCGCSVHPFGIIGHYFFDNAQEKHIFIISSPLLLKNWKILVYVRYRQQTHVFVTKAVAWNITIN